MWYKVSQFCAQRYVQNVFWNLSCISKSKLDWNPSLDLPYQFCHPHSFLWPSRNTTLIGPWQEKFFFLSFFEDGRLNSIPSGFNFITSCVQDILTLVFHATFSIFVLFSCFLPELWSLHCTKKCIFCNFELTSVGNLSIPKVLLRTFIKWSCSLCYDILFRRY